jgi:hypothetical protein
MNAPPGSDTAAAASERRRRCGGLPARGPATPVARGAPAGRLVAAFRLRGEGPAWFVAHRMEKTMSGTKPGAQTPRPKRSGPRPGWHKAVGGVLVVGGLAIIVVNLAMEFGAPRLLPGGHSFVYLFVGGAVAFSSLWPFGWMDR